MTGRRYQKPDDGCTFYGSGMTRRVHLSEAAKRDIRAGHIRPFMVVVAHQGHKTSIPIFDTADLDAHGHPVVDDDNGVLAVA